MVRGAIRPCTRVQSSDRARARGIRRHPAPTVGRDYGYGPEREASVVDPRPQGGATTLAW
jgi:hypothetical protein